MSKEKENQKPKSITLNVKIPDNWNEKEINQFVERVMLNMIGVVDVELNEVEEDLKCLRNLLRRKI